MCRSLGDLLQKQRVEWVPYSAYVASQPQQLEWKKFDVCGLQDGSYTIIERPAGIAQREWIYMRMDGWQNMRFNLDRMIVVRFRNPKCPLKLGAFGGTWNDAHMNHIWHLFATDGSMFRTVKHHKSRHYLIKHRHGNDNAGVASVLKPHCVWDIGKLQNVYPLAMLYFLVVVAPNTPNPTLDLSRRQLANNHKLMDDKAEFIRVTDAVLIHGLDIQHLSRLHDAIPFDVQQFNDFCDELLIDVEEADGMHSDTKTQNDGTLMLVDGGELDIDMQGPSTKCAKLATKMNTDE